MRGRREAVGRLPWFHAQPQWWGPQEQPFTSPSPGLPTYRIHIITATQGPRQLVPRDAPPNDTSWRSRPGAVPSLARSGLAPPVVALGCAE